LEPPKDFTKEEQDMTMELQKISNQVRVMRDEQQHMVALFTRHKQTIDSSESRVKSWSMFQIVIILAVCSFQVVYLRRFFESRNKGLRI
jgi:hypothetical protein